MLIPNSFTQAISNAFYDKTATVLSSGLEVDADGFAFIGTSEEENPTTFKCNTEFNVDTQTLEEYGFRTSVQLIVTTATDTDIALNAIISIGGKNYKVTELITNDSHKLLGCVAWLLKSQTLISA